MTDTVCNRNRARRTSLGIWLALTLLPIGAACPESASTDAATMTVTSPPATSPCLANGGGYLRARLKGSIDAELNWDNDHTECSGAVRPTDGGIRMRFVGKLNQPGRSGKLVLVFGIAGLREGQPGKAVPVNVTVIREGSGEFYGTQGDDKCMLDQITQTPMVGIPHRSRSYLVVARGFCTEPARAVQGKGVVLVTRFDYAGQVDFETTDESAGDESDQTGRTVNPQADTAPQPRRE